MRSVWQWIIHLPETLLPYLQHSPHRTLICRFCLYEIDAGTYRFPVGVPAIPYMGSGIIGIAIIDCLDQLSPQIVDRHVQQPAGIGAFHFESCFACEGIGVIGMQSEPWYWWHSVSWCLGGFIEDGAKHVVCKSFSGRCLHVVEWKTEAQCPSGAIMMMHSHSTGKCTLLGSPVPELPLQ